MMSNEGQLLWSEALLLASRYNDKTIMQKLLSVDRTNNAAAAELVPYSQLQVFRVTPVFYLEEALTYHKQNMNFVAGTFINEMEYTGPETLAKLEEVVKQLEKKEQELPIVKSFMETARKLSMEIESKQAQQLTKACKKFSVKAAEIVKVEGKLTCAKMNVSFHMSEGCLILPNGKKAFLDKIVQIENWKKVASLFCNKKQVFEGVFSVPAKDESIKFELSRQYLK